MTSKSETALDRRTLGESGKRAGKVTRIKHRTVIRSVKLEKLIRVEFTSTEFTFLCLT